MEAIVILQAETFRCGGLTKLTKRRSGPVVR